MRESYTIKVKLLQNLLSYSHLFIISFKIYCRIHIHSSFQIDKIRIYWHQHKSSTLKKWTKSSSLFMQLTAITQMIRHTLSNLRLHLMLRCIYINKKKKKKSFINQHQQLIVNMQWLWLHHCGRAATRSCKSRWWSNHYLPAQFSFGEISSTLFSVFLISNYGAPPLEA